METPTDTPATAARWAGLKLRVISALVMLTLVLFAILAGGIWFILLVLLAAVQMIREWDYLTDHQPPLWKLAGLGYVAIPCATLIWLRETHLESSPNAGMLMVLYLMFAVWATDIGAYFAGRRIGGPKLAPAISPNKTWAGLAGGMAAAAAIGGVCASFTPYPLSFSGCIFMGAVIALVAQAGDLFESWLKRRAGVKDSGMLIPGHGGLLDRVDGLIAAAPVYGLMVGFGLGA